MERKDLVVFGAGGLGREVMWQMSANSNYTEQYNFLGFVDDTPELQGKTINGYPVLGSIQWLLDYQQDVCAAICIGDSQARKAVYSKLKNNPFIAFPTLFAKDAQYSQYVEFGKGCIICLSSVITVNINIGDFVIVNWDCTVGHDSALDDFVTLYPSVNVSGNVHIGSCCEIGTGTNIIQGKSIGANSIIGAGSVVTKNIPANCTAVGVPAAPIKYHGENQ
jgi:sugar O-acyltransferase (sialic acid O-acetyltransferase NeuD family)